MRDSLNWVYRQLFRIGNWIFELYCYLFKPTRRGVYVAVWWNDRVLLINNSYRAALTLPSGGIGSQETPLNGAIRELKEEVGITVDTDKVKLLSSFTLKHDNIQDEVFAFELVFENQPEIRIDNREVTEAHFEELENALSLNLSAVAAHILELYSQSGRKHLVRQFVEP